MSTDPSEVQQAMASGESGRLASDRAGGDAVRAGPPAEPDRAPVFPPVQVHEVGPGPGVYPGEQ